MYIVNTVHTSTLHFKTTVFESRSVPRPLTLPALPINYDPNGDQDWTTLLRIRQSLQRTEPVGGTPPLQVPNRSPCSFPSLFSFPASTCFTASMTSQHETNTVTSSVYTETFTRSQSRSSIPRRIRKSHPPSKAFWEGAPKQGHREEKTVESLRNWLFDCERPRTFPIHQHHCRRNFV